VTLVPLGIALPALAQRGADKRPNDVNQAKQMTELIQQGQLSLRDATTVAEKHSKGTALEASVELQAGQVQPERPDARPGGPTGDQASAGARLIYEVTCFADNKLQVVRVDGLEKKVIGAKETGKLSGD
jgi:hypothetical protein